MSPASLPADPQDAPSGYGRGRGSGLLNRRLIGFGGALIVEIAIVLLLLTIGSSFAGPDDEPPQVTTFEARDVSDPPPSEPDEPADQARSEAPAEAIQQPVPPSAPPEAQPARELPTPSAIQPPPLNLPTPVLQPRPSPPQSNPAPPRQPGRTYGPPDTGPQGGANDSERVGTAPNGQPMFRARWYREPAEGELAGYLSTASGPGSALIVCRTVPDFYVEDCQLLSEAPRGSQIGRAVLAAAWQFRVRPPIVEGRSQVGSWVQIRIDYGRTIRR
jgi:protein TonB